MSDPGDPNRPDVGTGARPSREMPEFLQGDGPPGGALGGIFGSLRPPPRSEPYISLGIRPPGQWGKADGILSGARNYPGAMPGPFMPQQSDVRSLLSTALGPRGGLGAIGSPAIRALATGALRINDRWLKDFIAGRETSLKLLDAQQKRHLEEIDLRQQQESERYGLIMEYYKGKPEELRRHLRNAAVELGDTQGPMSMIAALDSGDMTAPERLVAARDKHWLSLSKVREQQAKIAAEEERTETARSKREDARLTREREDETLRRIGIDPARAPGVSVPEEAPATAAPAEDPAAVGRIGGARREDTGGDTGRDTGAGARPAEDTGEEPVDTGPSWLSGQAEPSAPATAPAAAPSNVAATTEQQPDPETQPPYQVAGLNWTGPPAQPPENAPEPSTQVAQATPAPAAPGAAAAPGPPDAGAAIAPPLGQIDRWAEDRILGGKGAPKYSSKRVDAAVTAAQTEREADMRNRFDRIVRDPRWAMISDPRARQQAVINAVSQVSPRIGQRVGQLVSGSALLTSRQAQQWEVPIALAGTADPTFNVNNPQARAASIRYYTTGLGGRQMLAAIVGSDHLDALEKAARELATYQTNSPLWNRAINLYYEQNPLGRTDPRTNQIMEAIERYRGLVHNVAPEVEFAISGKPATVSGREATEANWSPAIPFRILEKKIQDTRHLMRVRLADNMASFRAQVGGNPQINLLDLWGKYERGGGINDRTFDAVMPKGGEYDAMPVQPLLGGGSYTDKLNEMVGSTPPDRALLILRGDPSPATQRFFEEHFPGFKAKDFLNAPR